MLDPNPKPKGNPSLLRQLFEGGAFVPGAAGTNIIKNVGKQIASNVATNVDPYGYMNPVSRFLRGGVLNQMSENRMDTDYYNNLYKDEDKLLESKTRVDLANMWSGKQQRFNTVQKSEYRPTIGAEPNLQYYKIPAVEKNLFSTLVKTGIMKGRFNGPINSKEDLEKALDIGEDGYFSEVKDDSGKKIGYTGTIMSLGEGTVSVGEDEKGPYVSYYDKWDINPLSGLSSNLSNVLPKPLQRGIDKIVTGIPEKMGITSAPRVYGRIYFDRKTGKPVGKDFQNIFSQIQEESKKDEETRQEEIKKSGYTGRFSGLNKKASFASLKKKK